MKKTLYAKAELNKRHLLVGRMAEEIGFEKMTEILKELQVSFDRLDDHYEKASIKNN